MDLIVEREAFFARQKALLMEARQRLALQLSCGIDISRLETLDQQACLEIEMKITRLIERERQRGLTRHWSYDLNRHIALTQTLDYVRAHISKIKKMGQVKNVCIRTPAEIMARRASLRAAAGMRRKARTVSRAAISKEKAPRGG